MNRKKVIFIAAHPDDETLGCGGTILRHVKNGDEVVWLIITTMSVNNGFSNERVESRKLEIDRVARLFGFSQKYQLDFPTMQLGKIDESILINAIADVFKRRT